MKTHMKQAMKRVKNVLVGKKGDSMRKTMVLITIGFGLCLLSSNLLAAETGDKETAKNSMSQVLAIGNAELAVMLGEKPSAAEMRVTELLAERIKDRADVALAGPGDKAKFQIVIGKASSNARIKEFAGAHKEVASLGSDGYVIAVETGYKEIHIAGQSDSGVVAGVGRLIREMRYQNGRVEVPSLNIAETPQMPNRGMYLWARKEFFGKPDQVDRYVEEFALWGCNGIALWFEMGMFKSFDDPEAKKWLDIYRRLYTTAKRMGMKTGLLMVMNDAYNTSPTEMRIKPIIGCPNHYLCPNKPGSAEQMIAWQEQVFKALPQIDIFNKEYWKSLQAEMNDYSPELMKGGWPYSERWNTDLASVMMLSWFWNPQKSAESVLDEYAVCYFGPQAAAARDLLDLLDDSNTDPQRKEMIVENLAKLEGSLPEWVKRDWRWAEIAESCRFRTR
ncbi:MAG: hypothetical protein NTW21_29335 [Verrucomicrobia bacterium]|nr:hypothetical protein [Verrucomicrobiota bacterium]